MTGLEFLGVVMLVVMLFAIFIGLPISFTLLFLALIFGYFGLGVRVFNLTYLQTYGLMKQDEFVAVPMFILMGYICDQGGLMERLFTAFRNLFAPVRGSLYLVVITTATLFGIAAGTVGATVALLGIMAGPDDDQGRLRRAHVGRLHRRRRHARHPHSTFGDAGGDGAGARHLHHRPLRGSLRSGLPAVGHVHRLYAGPQLHQSQARAAGAEGGAAHLHAAGAVGMPGRPRACHDPHHRHAGGHPCRFHHGIGSSCHGRVRRHPARHGLRQIHLEGLLQRLPADACHVQHGAVPGGRLQRVRRRVRLARHGDLDHQHAAGSTAAGLGHHDVPARPDLPAGMAVRVAGDRADLPAAAGAGGQGPELRHGLVRLHRRRGAADRVPVAAGRHVGLLPEAGGQGVEPAPHLPGHGRLHGDPGDLRGAGADLPADCHVVPQLAAGAAQGRAVVADRAAARRPTSCGRRARRKSTASAFDATAVRHLLGRRGRKPTAGLWHHGCGPLRGGLTD